MIEMPEGLDAAILAGQTRAIARAISVVEAGGEQAAELVARLRPSARGGHLIGVTGSPGAGKSSLICKLAREFCARGRSVGVIAVDPSSPFSGGAFLGDRIRMPELACQPDVFVRSMASRGRSGGLAAAVEDAAVILKAAGKDVVLVETVGVGQGELDVANAVQTTVVVLTPGMGDEIQSLKAGLMEVAHIYVVNKADLPGADSVARSIHAYVNLETNGWERPVVKTSARDASGVAELADALERHLEFLRSIREADEQEIQRAQQTVLSIAGRQLLEALEMAVDPVQLERLAEEVATGAREPREAAEEVVHLFFASRLAATRN